MISEDEEIPASCSLERLEEELLRLKDPYERCKELYEDVYHCIWDDGYQNKYVLDTLTFLMLQHHVTSSETTIREIIEDRIQQLSSRELRVLVAGEVAAGKTTSINLMMGDKFLPVDNRHCTNVVCELKHTINVRKAEIIYKNGSGRPIEGMSTDKNDTVWKTIRKYIKNAYDNEKRQAIDKIVIYWPFEIFKDDDQTFPLVVAEESQHSTIIHETTPKEIETEKTSLELMSNKQQYLLETSLKIKNSMQNYGNAQKPQENNIYISRERITNEKWYPGRKDSWRTRSSSNTEKTNLKYLPNTEKTFSKSTLDNGDAEDEMEFCSDYEDVEKVARSGEENISEQQQYYSNIPIVFLDCPGIDGEKETFEPTMRNIQKCHTFIFLINVSNMGGVNESRLQKLMDKISETIEKQGVTFNAESALFIINKWTLCQENIATLRSDVIERLRREWPAISDEQLFVLPIKKMEYGENGLQVEFKTKPFQEALFKFLVSSVRRNLEEHCLWLKNFLEVMHSLMKTGKQWEKYQDHLSNIHDMAMKEQERMHDYLDQLSSSRLMKELEAKKHTAIQSVIELKNDNKALERYLSSPYEHNDSKLAGDIEKVESIAKTFQKSVDDLIQKERDYLLKNSCFTNVSLDHQMRREVPIFVKACVVFGTILTSPVTMPIAKLVLVGMGIYEALKNWMDGFDAYLQESLNTLGKDVGQYLDFLEGIIFGKTMQTPPETLTKIKEQIMEIGELYISKVIQHEFDAHQIRKKLTVENQLNHQGIYGIDISTQHGRVAVKKLSTSVHTSDHPDSLSFPKNLQMYRECIQMRQLTRKTDHPFHENFVKYFGSTVYEHGNTYHLLLVMELCDHDLSKVIESIREGNISTKQKIKYALGTAKGLKFFHDSGVVHRDIKPENFLVKNGIVKIADLGHSKELDRVATLAQGLGTNHYRAPETCNDDQYHTYESDIFSVGLVFWELWYGKRVPKKRPVQLNTPQPFPELFRQIIKSCLQDRPKLRPTISAVVRDLDKVLLKL